eukprot:snap_masked-scaffold_9-processed-gene-5.39-mRNA-1 protein AED:1.00 eAED:1.00 QI:0/-1/0/0/-1/1/1/0/511
MSDVGIIENTPSKKLNDELEARLLLQLSNSSSPFGRSIKKSTGQIYLKQFQIFKKFCDEKNLNITVSSFKKYAITKVNEGVSNTRLINYLTGVKNVCKSLELPIPKENWKGMHTFLRELKPGDVILPIPQGQDQPIEPAITFFQKKHLIHYVTRRLKFDDFAGLQKKVSVVLTLRGRLEIEENKKILKKNVIVLQNEKGVREVFITAHAPNKSIPPKQFVLDNKIEVDLVFQYLTLITEFPYPYFYVAYNVANKQFKNMIRNSEFFKRIPQEVATQNHMKNVARFNNASLHLGRGTLPPVDPNYIQHKDVVNFSTNSTEAKEQPGVISNSDISTIAAAIRTATIKNAEIIQRGSNLGGDNPFAHTENSIIAPTAKSLIAPQTPDIAIPVKNIEVAVPHKRGRKIQAVRRSARLSSRPPKSFAAIADETSVPEQQQNSTNIEPNPVNLSEHVENLVEIAEGKKRKIGNVETPWGPMEFSGSIQNLTINGVVHNYYYASEQTLNPEAMETQGR